MTTSPDVCHDAAPESSRPGRSEGARLRYRLETQLLGHRASSRLWGWIGPLLIAAIGGFFRFWQLARPGQLIFDETYYAKQGSSFLDYGYEKSVAASLGTTGDSVFLRGNPSIWGTAADFVVHPPVGKWMIAGGQLLFGPTNAFGWRFAAALCGTLSLLMIARIGRRLFNSTLLGCLAALLMAFDGHHFVHSRTALLDIFVMFWALAAFGAILLDRDYARTRLARRAADLRVAADDQPAPRIPGWGPGLGWRPWRIVAGLCLGLCCGTKWSGLYFLVAFGLLTVLWDVGARRAVGVRNWLLGGLVRDGVSGFLMIVPVAAAAYLGSWAGWFGTRDGWDRQWGAQNPSMDFAFIPDSVRGLWHYHQEMYRFHVGLETFHSYQSNPWSWLIQGRPTSFFYESKTQGQEGCLVAQCSKAITSLGTPALWWGGAIALVIVFAMWAFARDGRAGAIACGIAAGYLPWFAFSERTIYSFYSISFAPWVVLAVVYVCGLALGPRNASSKRRRIGGALVGLYVMTCVAMFFFFWPIWTAQVIPYAEWAQRMWFPSWI